MKPCCANLENRASGPGARGGEARPGLTITHCTVCKCRHFELEVDPGRLGLVGKGL